MRKLIIFLSIIFLTIIFNLTASPVLAINTEEEIAHSQVGDKVYEINRELFYAYTNSPAGSSIPDNIAPVNWRLTYFDDSFWGNAQDAFNAIQTTTTEAANNWWCLNEATNTNNCHYFGTEANDPKQITGPNGFLDGYFLEDFLEQDKQMVAVGKASSLAASISLPQFSHLP